MFQPIRTETTKVSVIWETDKLDVDDLPEEVEVPNEYETDEQIANYLSNEYGWIVKSFVRL